MFRIVGFLFSLFLIYSCSNSTSPNSNLNLSFKQIPGCNNTLLSKTLADSSFKYTFDTYADISFSLLANCCPENNRFDQITLLNDNTITITVIDTAAQLCRCICNYELNIKVRELTENLYTFICLYGDSILYNEKIIRD